LNLVSDDSSFGAEALSSPLSSSFSLLEPSLSLSAAPKGLTSELFPSLASPAGAAKLDMPLLLPNPPPLAPPNPPPEKLPNPELPLPKAEVPVLPNPDVIAPEREAKDD
jgi:hypothetical protein